MGAQLPTQSPLTRLLFWDFRACSIQRRQARRLNSAHLGRQTTQRSSDQGQMQWPKSANTHANADAEVPYVEARRRRRLILGREYSTD